MTTVPPSVRTPAAPPEAVTRPFTVTVCSGRPVPGSSLAPATLTPAAPAPRASMLAPWWMTTAVVPLLS